MSTSGITPTITFILSVLAILVIAISAPGIVQAMLGPEPTTSPGEDQPGNAIQASEVKTPGVNPAGLSDTGIFGTVGIGITSPISPLHIYSTTSTQPETIDLDGAQPITAQWNDYCSTGGSMSGSGFLARFARGSKISPSNVTNGDRLGFNVFGGWVGSWVHSAAIEAIVDSGGVSGSSLPTYMRFSTTPSGSTSRLERMRIAADGKVGINTTSLDSSSELTVYRNGGNAIYGTTTGSYGVYGISTATNNYGGLGDTVNGVYGQSSTSGGAGVYGQSTSTSAYGVYGRNTNSNYGYMGGSSYGVLGYHNSSGNYGYLGGSSYGVYGTCGPSGHAGYFDGDVQINGNLSKSTGTFKIDHPQDPENKYLQHSFVESPDMMNVYNGNIVLDSNGEAVVQMPSYFEALNRDFRYQLTCIGGYAPVYVGEEISGNHFKIAGGKSGLKVSWQVTGIRHDVYANAHPIVVELDKPANEKGLYLTPIEWGQPKEKGISTAVNK